MKIFNALLGLSLLSCYTPSKKLSVEPIYIKNESVDVVDPKTGEVTTKLKGRELTKRNDKTIRLINNTANKLEFQLLFNNYSGGLRIRRVKSLQDEMVRNGEDVTLKYYYEIGEIAGKEGNNISGYNYSSQQDYKVEKGVKHIKIQLYEKLSHKDSAKLVAEKSIDVLIP